MNTAPDCLGVIDYGVELSNDIMENYQIFKEIFKDDNTYIDSIVWIRKKKGEKRCNK